MAWLTGWKFRKKHDINGSTAGSVTDYQIKIVCHYGSGTDSGEDVYLNSNCCSDFGDIRFTDSDGSTLLDYWMEEKVDGDYAIFWVKVPSIPSDPNTATIYIYYGNPDATYAGDGEATFLFFDDFSTFDTAKWTELTGDWDVADGQLYIISDYGAAPGNIIYSSYQWTGEGLAVEYVMTLGTTHSGVAVVNDPSTKSLDYYYYSEKNDGSFHNYYDGSAWGSAVTLYSQAYAVGDVIRGRLILPSGTLHDLTNAKSGSDAPHYSSGYIGFNQPRGFTTSMKVDWIFIRKHIDPEPSHGTWYAAEAMFEFSESIATSDVIVKSVSITRAESLSLSDVVSALRVKIKELVESIGLSDVVVKFASIVRSETITVSDVLQTVKTMYREFVETVGLSDRISKLTSIIKSETLSLTDILEKRFVILKVLTETLGLSDTLARIRIRKTLARIKGVTRILNAIREKPAERELGR